MKGWRPLLCILLMSLLLACSAKALNAYERSGFVIQVVEATVDDKALIKNAWQVRDLVETRAYRMEQEISYEFKIKDGKDLRNIAKLRALFAGLLEQNGKAPFSIAPYQDKHLIDFIRQRKGTLSLRIYVGDKLKHYEACDLTVNDSKTTVHSLLIK